MRGWPPSSWLALVGAPSHHRRGSWTPVRLFRLPSSCRLPPALTREPLWTYLYHLCMLRAQTTQVPPLVLPSTPPPRHPFLRSAMAPLWGPWCRPPRLGCPMMETSVHFLPALRRRLHFLLEAMASAVLCMVLPLLLLPLMVGRVLQSPHRGLVLVLHGLPFREPLHPKEQGGLRSSLFPSLRWSHSPLQSLFTSIRMALPSRTKGNLRPSSVRMRSTLRAGRSTTL